MYEYFIESWNITIFLQPTIRSRDNPIQKYETNFLTKIVVLKKRDFANQNMIKRLLNKLFQAFFNLTTKAQSL